MGMPHGTKFTPVPCGGLDGDPLLFGSAKPRNQRCSIGSQLRSFTVYSSKFDTALGLFRKVDEHCVVQPGPLRVARVQFIIGKFASVRTPPGFCGKSLENPRPAALGGFVAIRMKSRE